MKNETMDWIDISYKDLIAATVLYELPIEVGLYHSVAYHLSQGVEKLITAFYIENSVTFAYNYSIFPFINNLAKINPKDFTQEFIDTVDRFDFLTNQTRMRYPDSGINPSEYYTKAKIDECFELANKIIVNFLPLLELSEEQKEDYCSILSTKKLNNTINFDM